MSPRADFACLSKACRTDSGATVYELPVGATHCPMGHKRLTRIWTPPHISTGHAKAVDAIAEAPILAAEAKRDEIALAARRYPMVKPVPMRNLGAALQHVYQANGAPPAVAVNQADLTRKAALGGSPNPVVSELQNARMPVEIAARDREYRLVKGKDGPEIEKAT
jgi:hypothetical protein